MKPKNLIAFDMDGVIMDVSASYRDVVRQTARLFFQPARGAEQLPDPLFDLVDLAAIKQTGGLNNDWDLTFVVINLLFTLVDPPPIHPNRESWQRYREIIGRCDVTTLAALLNSQDCSLISLLKQQGRPENDFIASCFRGDVGTGNIIKQIFQEIYLGEELFRSTYGLNPTVYQGEGYILREKVMIDRQLLEELAGHNMLAIATGRPRSEAEYPLNHYQLNQFFSQIWTLDDCLAEEKRIFELEGRTVALSKPNPFMLNAIVKNCRQPFKSFFYVGDMPDDMLAAARSDAECQGIGILLSAPDKKNLKKDLIEAGADYVIDSFEALRDITL